jgi:site-specific recombinase XerD
MMIIDSEYTETEISLANRRYEAKKMKTNDRIIAGKMLASMPTPDDVEAILKGFKDYLSMQENSANTIRSYVYSVKMFYKLYKEVNKANLIQYKQFLMEKYAERTAFGRITAMNQFLKYIEREELRVNPPKISKTYNLEDVPTKREYKKFLKWLKENKKEKMYWVLRYIAESGARIGEVVKFEKEDLLHGEAEVFNKGKKRQILFPKTLIEESYDYLVHLYPDSPYLFPNRYGGQMTTRGIAHMINKYGQEAGIRKSVCHPHAFRHYFAITFLKHSKNDITTLKDLLGHDSLDTTMVYAQISKKQQRNRLNRAINASRK